MSQGPNPPQKRCVPRIFRRQNSFAGFPSATLSIFSGTNDPIDSKANDNSGTVVTSSNVKSSQNESRQPSSLCVSSTSITTEGRSSVASSTSGLSSFSQSNSQKQSLNVKSRRAPSSKMFYSLPRHATTSSNPALLKESASGLGVYLMSRNARNRNKTSAAEQLGVSPAKFLSLPRPTRKQPPGESSSKSLVYRSLPRPYSKPRYTEVFSLPLSNDTKSRSSGVPVNLKKMTRDPADGREADPKPKRRDFENFSSNSTRSNFKDTESTKKKDDAKTQAQQQIPKENDPKYHPRSRTVVKNDSWKPIPPRRDDYILYYKRPGTEDFMCHPIVRYPEKEFLQYYPPPLRPPDYNYNFRSFPRTDREIHDYQTMYRRPDGTNMFYPVILRPYNYDKCIRSDLKPPVNPNLSAGYVRDYQTPPYNSYQLIREPTPNSVTSYQPPPPLLPKRLNKPEPTIFPPYSKPIIEEVKYQSLPRKPVKEMECSYQSLPRRFGRENELRFYPINNADTVEDPGYESLKTSAPAEQINKNNLKPQNNEIKNEFSKADEKENEPKYQMLSEKPDVVADHTNFTFSDDHLDLHYQTVQPQSPQSQITYDSKKTNSLPSKRSTRDRSQEPKYQSVTKKREDKYLQLSRKSRDTDSKYQSIPKRKLEKEKDYDRPPPPLPKRVPREGADLKHTGSHPRKSSKERESNRRSNREESRSSIGRKSDKNSPATNRTCSRRQQEPIPSSQQPPRSPRWTHPDTDDEDGIYSTVKTREEPVYQSVSEVTYTRPLPPVPAPSRYRRRPQDDETAPPPPLPPPRLTTGPVSPHNPLLNSTIPTASSGGLPINARPQILRTPSSSPENVIHKIPSPTQRLKPKEKDDDDLYSSIPSPISSQDSPSFPRNTLQPRVASSASWDSLGSSVGSSGGSSRNSSLASSTKEITNSRRRRRAVSDPRMDAGVLHRLAFTVWHTALHIEKEVRNQGLISSNSA